LSPAGPRFDKDIPQFSDRTDAGGEKTHRDCASAYVFSVIFISWREDYVQRILQQIATGFNGIADAGG
jgi:hypothetical protein